MSRLDEVFTEVELIKTVSRAETEQAKKMLARMDGATFESLVWVISAAYQLVDVEQRKRTEKRMAAIIEESMELEDEEE